MNHKSQYSKLVLVALMVISAVLGLLRFNSLQVGTYYDDASYIILAERIASGRGYSAWAFPPGWPLLLTPFVTLFPGNYAVLKLLSFTFWLASIPLAYRLFSARIGTPYLEILVALVALNPSLLAISGMVMSEAAYLFFSLLTLNIFEHWNAHPHRTKDWPLIGVALIAVYTQLIRTVGLSIVLTVIVYLLLSRHFRQLGIVAAAVVLGMLPQFWLNSQSGGLLVSPGYESQVLSGSFITKLSQAWNNVQGYSDGVISNSLVPALGSRFPSTLDRVGLGILSSVGNILTLLTIIVGIVLSLRYFKVSDLYAGLYFVGILAFWNPGVGSTQARFLIPLIPFLYFYVIQALVWSVHWIVTKNDTRASLVVIALVSPVILLAFVRNIQDWQNPVRNRLTDLSIGTTWIRENTPQESVVMARDPTPDYLYARRKTVVYPSSSQDIETYIRANNVDYILVSPKLGMPRANQLDDFTETRLVPFLTSRPSKYRIVYTNTVHNVAVYQVYADE